MHRFIGVLGILFVLGMAFLMSNNRRAIRYKTVAWGLGLQIVLAFLVMRWTWGQWAPIASLTKANTRKWATAG